MHKIGVLMGAAPSDVIMVFSNLALAVLKPMAGNVPVVFVGVGDPVGDGFVASLAHPGANITGFAGTGAPMAGKWLEVLKETAPGLTRAMAIVHLETPAHQAMWNAIRDAAPRLGVEVTAVGVHDAAEIERATASFASKENGGIIVLPHAVALDERRPHHRAGVAAPHASDLCDRTLRDIRQARLLRSRFRA